MKLLSALRRGSVLEEHAQGFAAPLAVGCGVFGAGQGKKLPYDFDKDKKWLYQ